MENTRALRGIGLVSGACWSDLNEDGFPELLLACEWGPIRVFQNRSGGLVEVTAELGLDQTTGWWTGVTTGDIDGDGRLDILAGNWGLNSDYRATPQEPTRVYYGDLAGRGMTDLIEAEFDDRLRDFAPRRRIDALAPSLPFLQARFQTAKAFSEASMAAVLGPDRAKARIVDANTLASTLFLNRGKHFQPIQLPREAQFSPAFAVCVADFNGDGHEDVFLSQNFFGNEPETPRQDAGRGLLLVGDGTGQLRPVPGQESGVKVYGEQRGAAVADYDHDGRADLVVTQNGAATLLFHNEAAQPGLRVVLQGSPGNPSAIGAVLRLHSQGKPGPAREVRAGSGYWSQDGAVQVLARPAQPAELWVRWPGGKVTKTAVPDHARELVVKH
jgi:hypothetical protein